MVAGQHKKMNTPKILRAKAPVMYRWLRRRRSFPTAVLLACAASFLPVGIMGGVKLTNSITANNAMAATRAMLPEHDISDILSARERAHYASTLNGLIADQPDKILDLIGPDILVMYDEPDLQRQDGGFDIWQYRTDLCVLDVYLDNAADTGMVMHYEVRPRKLAAFGAEGQHERQADHARCLQSLFDQRTI